MRKSEILAALLVPGLLAYGPALAATGARFQWESQGRQARLAVERPSADGQALAVLLALPAGGNWQAVSLSLDGKSVPTDEHLRLSRPFVFRRVRVGQILIEGGGAAWRRAEIALASDRPFSSSAGVREDPLLAGLLANPQAAEPRAPEGPGSRDEDEIFDGSGRWLRIDVKRSGIYHIDYQALYLAGVTPGTDTGSFRLLGTGGKGQPFRMSSPGGSWERGWTLPEVPILVKGGAGFNQATELSFYLPGLDGFESEFEPGAQEVAYRRNHYSPWASYFLSWDGLGGLRVSPRDATPQAGDPVQASLTAKLHREENYVFSNHFLHEDGWAWEYYDPSLNPELFVEDFPLIWPDVSEPFRLRIGFDAPSLVNVPTGPHHVRGYIGAMDEAHRIIDESFNIVNSLAQVELDGERLLGDELAGANSARFSFEMPKVPPLGLENDYGYLLWYEVYYATRPRSRNSNPLDFYLPDGARPVEVRPSGWAHEPEIWDVTDPFAPEILEGGLWAGDSLRLRVSAAGERHLICVDPEHDSPGDHRGYLEPDQLRPVAPAPLRNDAQLPHMIVVTFDQFREDAERYAAWRRQNFPGIGTGEVEVVNIGDIYANFGSGMLDPAALRNFLKYRYETPGSRLSYLLLLGDANYDYRNFLGRDTLGDGTNCLIPALSDRFRTDLLLQTYTTDDYICDLDLQDDSLEISVPDLAVGRLPASDEALAKQMVDMVIAYEADYKPAVWANRVALAADDYYTKCSEFDGIPHTTQAETLYVKGMPPQLDVEKIYMCEWDCDFAGFKPEAQKKLFSLLQDGVLIFNYVGHGGDKVLADENLLLSTRIPELINENRRFFFISASCNVGKYDESARSMSEEMISQPGGGAIGTMASSALSGAFFNNVLNRNFLQELFPGGELAPCSPIGLALLRAKVNTQLIDLGGQQVGAQNERYSILGDPALALSTASLQVVFDQTETDTLRVGSTHSLSGRILRNGILAPDFNGVLHLSVRASEDTSGYTYYLGETPVHVNYHLPGPEIFRGRIPVVDGRFETPTYFVPGLPDSTLGPYGRIRGFAAGEYEAAVGIMDSIPVVPGILPSDDSPPEVTLSVAGGADYASPGTELIIRATAATGINFVGTGTHPRNSILLEYLNAGEVENLTQNFEYDLGSASSGEARTQLPSSLPLELNTLVCSVADNLGNIGRDTLRIQVVEEGRVELRNVRPFPNPFAGHCSLTFRVTAPARVDCDIYTLSGRRIWRRSQECPDTAPLYAFEWDGKDGAGDEVANGTYLYRLSADFSGRRRELTGALVRMRD